MPFDFEHAGITYGFTGPDAERLSKKKKIELGLLPNKIITEKNTKDKEEGK